MTDAAQRSQTIEDAAQETAAQNDAAMTRLAVRMAIGGFALMFLAGAMMWLKVGPTIFVDLATAVVNCF
jgi:CHASE3 domain sensor protein